MSDLLKVRGLCKGYRSGSERLEVLVDLSLDLEEGEMMAVTGVSGSGKSTLLHLLGGMDRPDRGSIRIQGTEITTLALPELSCFRNHTVGFVFQFHHLLPEFTALENVMMPLRLRGESPAAAQARACAALEDVRMKERVHHRPGELSGGEQQRVAIARALVGMPKLLLADEPTGDLDLHTGTAIGELLRSLHERHGLTSIVVTHNEKLAGICSRSCRLENGQLNPKESGVKSQESE
ncbi:MAG: ABC transporter ATP-binding protein [Acidobacteriia bacterium]|nr:ABC transporter ATP-binding protein [Terriglobia bacterium]